VAKYNF